MLNADLPQPLCSPVVGKLKADSTFKLLVLEREDNREKYEGKYSWRWSSCFAVGHLSISRWTTVYRYIHKKGSKNTTSYQHEHWTQSIQQLLFYAGINTTATIYKSKHKQILLEWGLCFPISPPLQIEQNEQDQDRGRIKSKVQTLEAKGRKSISWLYIYTLYPSILAVAAAAAALLKGALYLARSQAHCAALSLDWAWPRQPVTLRLSMDDKLQCCTAQWGGLEYRPWPCRGAKLEV